MFFKFEAFLCLPWIFICCTSQDCRGDWEDWDRAAVASTAGMLRGTKLKSLLLQKGWKDLVGAAVHPEFFGGTKLGTAATQDDLWGVVCLLEAATTTTVAAAAAAAAA